MGRRLTRWWLTQREIARQELRLRGLVANNGGDPDAAVAAARRLALYSGWPLADALEHERQVRWGELLRRHQLPWPTYSGELSDEELARLVQSDEVTG